MIIIINGPLGVGKSDVSWALIKLFDRAVMLDGDYIGAIHPFKIEDPERTDYLYETISHLVEFHYQNSLRNFVINYVFEEPDSLGQLVDLLGRFDLQVKTFRLSAEEQAIEERVRRRNHSAVEWELKRFKELSEVMNAPEVCDRLGYVIDTSNLSIEQVAKNIIRMARKP